MACARGAEPIPIPSSSLERLVGLRVFVVFTSLEATRSALQTAVRLSSGLHTQIVLLAAKEVPYTLPLECPPASRDFIEQTLANLASGLDTDVVVRMYLCRDHDETIRLALSANSVVVVGVPKRRFRPCRYRKLFQMLRNDGHRLIQVDAGEARQATFAPPRVGWSG